MVAKLKKTSSWEIFLIIPEMELSGSNIERFLIFSCISGNGNPKKLFIFWKMELLSWSLEKKNNNPLREDFLCSEKIDHSSSNIKKVLIFYQKKAFLNKTNKQTNKILKKVLYFEK